MCYEFFLVAWQHVDDRNLNHSVTTWLLLERSTCHINKHLCCEGRVVNLHIEFEELVVGLTTDTLTSKVYSMTNIIESINAINSEDMSLIISKVWVSFDSLCYLFEFCALFEFYIYHTAMNTFSDRNCHRESIL